MDGNTARHIASTDGAVIADGRTGLLLPHIQHHVCLESADFRLFDQQFQLFILSIEETSFPPASQSPNATTRVQDPK
jgi:hypothetical protein